MELPHPISNLTAAAMRALTRGYVAQVVQHLTGPQGERAYHG